MTLSPRLERNVNDLTGTVKQALSTQRPILHHLNADTSWLIQIPVPNLDARQHPASTVTNASRATRDRRFFNILIDPWLAGSQSDVASWFSQQWHMIESAVSSIQRLEEVLKEADRIAEHELGLKGPGQEDSFASNGSATGLAARTSNDGDMDDIASQTDQVQDQADGAEATADVRKSRIDVIIISHEFSDHCHKETLVTASRSIPVLANDKAAELIRSWQHFDIVITAPLFAPKGPPLLGLDMASKPSETGSAEKTATDWRTLHVEPLPEWLSISILHATGPDAFYYHSAMVIAFSNGASQAAGAIIYTPHGVHAATAEPLIHTIPPLRPLAFLHGLHDVSMAISMGGVKQLNLGAHNGLAVQKKIGATYWIGTHDEKKKASGFVSWILRRAAISLQEALGQEGRHTNGDDSEVEANREGKNILDDVNYSELGNGESLVLV